METPIECDPEIIELVKKRLGFSNQKVEEIMTPNFRSWHEFKTYKSTFERLRYLFWILMKMKRVPEIFYLKFCLK